MIVVWPSNWIILLRVVRHSLAVGLVVEVGVQALSYAGVIKAVPGFALVLWSCVDGSYSYGRKRDRIDGPLGAVVVGIILASFFGALTWLLLAVHGRALLSVPLVVALFSLAVNLVTVVDRGPDRPHRVHRFPRS
ncbi:hypothetical protein [Anaeromyxobacter oryzisoli]|uniref:hypothetical protein n=1 Tax=Anaeromyxobacter oryzisoli TaxID=2925408 RepID=UPI001F56CA10|nr:hypothetical protein [Anaeromyxobacter sp. SG63]